MHSTTNSINTSSHEFVPHDKNQLIKEIKNTNSLKATKYKSYSSEKNTPKVVASEKEEKQPQIPQGGFGM